jgi:hypothetical protein
MIESQRVLMKHLTYLGRGVISSLNFHKAPYGALTLFIWNIFWFIIIDSISDYEVYGIKFVTSLLLLYYLFLCYLNGKAELKE